jgi:hypothetical protein
MLVDRGRTLKETPRGVDNMYSELKQRYLDKMRPDIEKFRAEGLSEIWIEGWINGWIKGYISVTTLECIKSLMETQGFSAEAAMDALLLPEDVRMICMDLLAEQ